MTKVVPIISAVFEGLVKLVSAVKCKCKSSCMNSEYTQRQEDEHLPKDILDYVQELKTIQEDVTTEFSESESSEKKGRPL